MSELKPCPFCGGEAKQMNMGYPHRVYCVYCGANIKHDLAEALGIPCKPWRDWL